MNKKNNRKGFTTVELVIVIAVIAILATVLIPTFSNLITKANESAALQAARDAMTSVVLEKTVPSASPALVDGDFQILAVEQGTETYYYAIDDGELVEATVSNANVTVKVGDNTWTITSSNNSLTVQTETANTNATATVVSNIPDVPSEKVTVYDVDVTVTNG